MYIFGVRLFKCQDFYVFRRGIHSWMWIYYPLYHICMFGCLLGKFFSYVKDLYTSIKNGNLGGILMWFLIWSIYFKWFCNSICGFCLTTVTFEILRTIFWNNLYFKMYKKLKSLLIIVKWIKIKAKMAKLQLWTWTRKNDFHSL